MIAAFFHDERFTRDASGTYRGTGAVPYAAFSRYLRHFERLVVVGRLDEPNPSARTVVSGEGVEFACIPRRELSTARALSVATRHVREVLARADAAVIRMPSRLGILACREALRTEKPFLVEVVADCFEALWNHGSWKGRVAALPMAALARHYIARAPFSVYVTRAALQRRYPPGGVSVAVSDVVVDAVPDVLERRLARIRTRPPGSVVTLGHVGSYDVGYKGHDTALRAVALLLRGGRRVRLRCIGGGDSSRWRSLADALGVASSVELGSALPQGEAVLHWMDGLDAYLAPSLVEGLPRAVVEAMSRALPVVASRIGGIPELVGAPWLHPARDHRRVAALVAMLIDDPGSQLEQARRSWNVASEYASAVLDARRDAFLRRFSASIVPAASDRRERALSS